jgi:hypothetical protein
MGAPFLLPFMTCAGSYSLGCRCVACRAAHAAYGLACRRCPVGSVDAAPVRAHLEQLRAGGLGVRQLGKLGGVSARHVGRILLGQVEQLRPATAAALLGVRPVLARGALVPGTRTHRFLDSLGREGFTRRELAFHLGAACQQLQFRRRVRVSSALRVAMLYNRITGDHAPA